MEKGPLSYSVSRASVSAATRDSRWLPLSDQGLQHPMLPPCHPHLSREELAASLYLNVSSLSGVHFPVGL